MSNTSIYATKQDCDLPELINQIAHLAKVGAAGTDSALNLDDMNFAFCSVFEVIYAMADRAYTMASELEDDLEKAKKAKKAA